MPQHTEREKELNKLRVQQGGGQGFLTSLGNVGSNLKDTITEGLGDRKTSLDFPERPSGSAQVKQHGLIGAPFSLLGQGIVDQPSSRLGAAVAPHVRELLVGASGPTGGDLLEGAARGAAGQSTERGLQDFFAQQEAALREASAAAPQSSGRFLAGPRPDIPDLELERIPERDFSNVRSAAVGAAPQQQPKRKTRDKFLDILGGLAAGAGRGLEGRRSGSTARVFAGAGAGATAALGRVREAERSEEQAFANAEAQHRRDLAQVELQIETAQGLTSAQNTSIMNAERAANLDLQLKRLALEEGDTEFIPLGNGVFTIKHRDQEGNLVIDPPTQTGDNLKKTLENLKLMQDLTEDEITNYYMTTAYTEKVSKNSVMAHLQRMQNFVLQDPQLESFILERAQEMFPDQFSDLEVFAITEDMRDTEYNGIEKTVMTLLDKGRNDVKAGVASEEAAMYQKYDDVARQNPLSIGIDPNLLNMFLGGASSATGGPPGQGPTQLPQNQGAARQGGLQQVLDDRGAR